MSFSTHSSSSPAGVPWFVQAAGATLLVLALFGMQAAPHGASHAPLERNTPRVMAGVSLTPVEEVRADGEQIYNTRCMSCHQMNGQGVPSFFPPLAGSEWVTGDKGRLIRLLLHGMSGEVEVKGTTYSGTMPPWGSALDDEEMAALVTYIRSSWGNEAPEVTADEVARVRAATEGRAQPWTAEELTDEANQGVPGEE